MTDKSHMEHCDACGGLGHIIVDQTHPFEDPRVYECASCEGVATYEDGDHHIHSHNPNHEACRGTGRLSGPPTYPDWMDAKPIATDHTCHCVRRTAYAVNLLCTRCDGRAIVDGEVCECAHQYGAAMRVA